MVKMNKSNIWILGFAEHFQTLEKDRKPFLKPYPHVLQGQIILEIPLVSCEMI